MTDTPHQIKCSACGTSPVNHNLLLFSDILDATLGKINASVFYFTNTDKWEKFSIFLEKVLFEIFAFLKIVTFSKDVEKALTGRSKLIWEEANKRGIKMEQVKIFGKPVEFYRAIINGKKRYFQSLPIPPWLQQSGYKWLDDKFKLYQVLSKNNIKVPKAYKISNLSQAKKAFENLSKPVIIKPQNGSRGRHTTTNINTEEELINALNLSRQITLFTVMQEHLFGSVCRATVINNKLVGFFRATPPQIIGDGIHTIQELIDDKNKNRNKKISDVNINDDLIDFIKRQNYTLDSILEKDKIIDLSAKTGRFYGGYTEEMLPKIHPKMHDIFSRAGSLIKAPIAGFDLIIKDPTKDPDTERWGIIECNSLPFIDLHYFALEGNPVNLAENIWDLWKKEN
ncbi:ATP-grasp domain-containing protein [Candidatus Nomurabacteria bacterium]|nr:ATP-grasp domain-containing protein [Candidatus Nomurabacteria bacterium]